MHSTCSPCDTSCPAYLQGGLTPNTVPNFMPYPNAEHADQLLYTDLPYFKAMAKDLNIKLAEVRTALKESEIENARLKEHIQLHAGDCLTLSSELDDWKARAEEAENRNATVFGDGYLSGWEDRAHGDMTP